MAAATLPPPFLVALVPQRSVVLLKKDKKMIVLFLTPAVIAFVFMFLYPVSRTVIMSLYEVESVTASTDVWKFNGIQNYIAIWNNPSFRASMFNILRIWLVGGVCVLGLSLLFAVILTSGVRGKSFFRAVIYLPNVISAVALATMWMQYVFNRKYGLLNDISGLFGVNVNWLGSDMKFWSMLIAFIFGAVGYYMLIFLSGIERIPGDLYEAATIDGASKIQQFISITVPLLRGVFKTNLTFWSINTITFYVWSKMFSPVDSELSTISPVVYMTNIVFGSKGVTERSAGRGAAVGVTLAVFVLVIFTLFNVLIKDDDYEL